MQEYSYQYYLLGLFAVANNIPAIPLFLSLCSGLTKKEQLHLTVIATVTSLITMLVAMFTGTAILNFFDISIPAFRIAGGLLLLFTGLKMMNSDPSGSSQVMPDSYRKKVSTAIIPVAIPLTTGAGTMSTVILFTGNMHHSHSLMLKLLVAIFVMALIIFLSFRYSTLIMKYLGATGMDVLTKVFGLITLAIGIQFILDGLKASFPSLG